MFKKSTKPRISFLRSIYGQVITTITLLSIILFVAFGIIFNSINQRYLDSIVQHCGDNISSIVEGALYNSMLTNDNTALHNALDVLNSLSHIEEVGLYDEQDNLVYSPYAGEKAMDHNPDCKSCHVTFENMFPGEEKSYQVISLDNKCEMSNKEFDYRLLMMKSPILNQSSCYTAACHAHQESDRVLGSFIIQIPLVDLDNTVGMISRDFFILAMITTLLLVTFLLFFTRKQIRRPLNEVIRASEAVSRGDTSSRLEMGSTRLNDIRALSTAFNTMLDNLQSASEQLRNWSQQLEFKVQKKSEELSEMQQEMIHVERIASLGKLSSSVAHEINNPLSGVLTYTKLVHKQLLKTGLGKSEKDPMIKYLKVIEEETKRCGNIVKGLLDFSRKDQSAFNSFHLHGILKDSFVLMEHQMKMANIHFLTDLSAQQDSIHCNENQIKQACIAILLNSTEAIHENGEISMKTSNPDPQHIKLEISDNGVGISLEDIPHVFEPFFSAKEKTSGIGLGLSIVHGIVQNHSGTVEVDSELGKGTTISMLLPLNKDH